MPQAAAIEDRGDEFEPTEETAAVAEAEEAEAKVGAEADTEAGAEAEAEVEAEAEPEVEAKAEEPESKEARDRRIRIPKWRLDEANARARSREEQLNARIAALEANPAPATQAAAASAQSQVEALETQIAELDDKYDAFIADGEKEKAATVRRERRALERAQHTAEVEYYASLSKNQAKAEFYYESTLQAMEESYPELNPENEEFDAELAEDIAGMRDSLVARGVSPATALERAVFRVVGAPKSGEAVVASTSTGAKAETKATREAAARTASAKAVAGAPPRTGKVGLDSDRLGGGVTAKSVLLMSQDEFAKLTDDKKAEMRGDVV